MTSDTNAPREALAKAMRNATGDSYPSNCICYRGGPSWGEYLEDADAVIRYLWQCAEDPEVVEAVELAMMNVDVREFGYPLGVYTTRPQIEAYERAVCRAMFLAGLGALLGPRPNGEGAEHGN